MNCSFFSIFTQITLLCFCYLKSKVKKININVRRKIKANLRRKNEENKVNVVHVKSDATQSHLCFSLSRNFEFFFILWVLNLCNDVSKLECFSFIVWGTQWRTFSSKYLYSLAPENSLCKPFKKTYFSFSLFWFLFIVLMEAAIWMSSGIINFYKIESRTIFTFTFSFCFACFTFVCFLPLTLFSSFCTSYTCK